MRHTVLKNGKHNSKSRFDIGMLFLRYLMSLMHQIQLSQSCFKVRLHLLLIFKEIFISRKEQQLLAELWWTAKLVNSKSKEMHLVHWVMKTKLLHQLTCLRFKKNFQKLKQIGGLASRFVHLFQQLREIWWQRNQEFVIPKWSNKIKLIILKMRL